MTFIVGLTGGIGCGKSSASKLFSELGIDVVDTDVIARQLTQPHGQAISSIKDSFGNAFLASDGSLDRNKMRNLIFSDNRSRHILEKILHPLILQETLAKIEHVRSPYIIIVVPLLFETNDYEHLVHRILVIDCEEQMQISRTMARSQLSERQVKAIMAQQISRKDRLHKADDVIINDRNIDFLKAQVIQLHRQYLTLSEDGNKAAN